MFTQVMDCFAENISDAKYECYSIAPVTQLCNELNVSTFCSELQFNMDTLTDNSILFPLLHILMVRYVAPLLTLTFFLPVTINLFPPV